MSQWAPHSLDRTRTTFPEDLRRVTPLQRSLSAGPRLQTQVRRAAALVNMQHVPSAVHTVILVTLCRPATWPTLHLFGSHIATPHSGRTVGWHCNWCCLLLSAVEVDLVCCLCVQVSGADQGHAAAYQQTSQMSPGNSLLSTPL